MTLHPSPSPAESIPDQDCDDGDDDDDDEIKDDHPRQSPPFANLSSVSSPFPGRSARPLALAPVPMMAPPPPPPRDPLSVLPRPHFEPVRLSIRTPDVFFSDDDEGEDGGEGQRNRPSEDVFFPPPRPVSLLARRPPSTPDSDALLSAEPLAGARSSLPPPLAHPRPVIVTRPNVSASFGTISTHQAPPTAARSLTDPLSPATLQTFSALMDSLQSSVLSDNHSEEEVDDDSSAVPHEAITTTIPPHLLIPQLPFSLSNSASPRQSSAAGPSPPAASFQGVAGQPAFRSRYDILMHLRPQRGPAAALNTQGTPGAQPQRLHQHGNHHNHTHLNQHHHHHQHLQHHHHHQHLHQPQQQHHHQHRQHQQHHHQRVQHPSRSLGQRSQVSDMPHEISTSEARANRMLQSVGPELAASFLVGFRAKLAELEREMYDANGVVDWVGDSVGALLRRRAARCGEECDEEREQQQEPNKEDQARERSGGGGDGHAGIGSGASAFAATGEQGEPCARLQETSRRSRMRTTRMGSDSVNGGGFGGGGCSNQYGDGDGAGEFFEFDMWSGRRRTAEWKIEWLLQRHKDLRGMKREWRELSAACDEIEWLLVRSSARLDR
ncbi:hypothetical protein DFJ73DRAFT_818225 [Zopfochytrium polystomum]|nr:hypothetical protein DFJ73DRAFT_818225 [Zopfochytrium polystomum]